MEEDEAGAGASVDGKMISIEQEDVDLVEINGDMYVGDVLVEGIDEVQGNEIVALTPTGKVSGCKIGANEVVPAPFVGMVFPNLEAVDSFYKNMGSRKDWGCAFGWGI
ncbi:uncharacterized protein LOC130590144 [Beta vulgaris subsp. vulgaris]|uniref:uncharacterized protein LOC130590144 n=1 Tax=Beta vulgaris subsp. vulgaris TaxID=3555 RepID=UPI002547A8AC|nr:uncharacterized protein LOC130590144 [Beta vulgaris subsp. vulgaris]